MEVPVSKAAFLCVKDSLAVDLSNQDELQAALQHAGYNPTPKFLNRYWTKETDSISYQEFNKILQLEPLPRKIDLLSYFRTFDTEEIGTLDVNDLKEALLSKASQSPSNKTDVLSILNDEKYLKDGKFDYQLFCHDVFETSNQLIEEAKQKVAEYEETFSLNSKTYKIKRKSSSPLKSPDKSRWTKVVKKGAFYFEGDVIISHQYIFTVKEKGRFDVSIQPQENQAKEVDCQLYIFKLPPNQQKSSPEAKVQLVGRSPLASFSDKYSLQRRSWTGTLSEGSYLLVPCTTGCHLRRRNAQPEEGVEIVSKDGEEVNLTKEFVQTLSEIFNQIDLDGNGSLSRTEFNLFNWRTSGEEVQDEEWEVVKENFATTKNELSLEGFLKLHQMEAEDSNGDSAELWITLNAMGYNAQLVQDEAAPIEVCVRSENQTDLNVLVSGLRSGGSLLDKATIRCVMQETAKPMNIGKSGAVMVFKEESGVLTSYAIENKSTDLVKVHMDFSDSKNVLINHPHFVFDISLSPKSTVFVAHLLPKDLRVEHFVTLKCSLKSQ